MAVWCTTRLGDMMYPFLFVDLALAKFGTRDDLWPEGLGMECVTVCLAISGVVYCIFLTYTEDAGTVRQLQTRTK